MIPWGWLIIAFVVGAWFGLFIVGLLRAATKSDGPWRREGTK